MEKNKLNKDILDLFVCIIEKAATGKMNHLKFAGDDMVFYRNEIHIIQIIGNNKGIFQSDIARKMNVTRAVVHKSLRKLEGKGFIYLRENPDDSRTKNVFLTEKGVKAYEAHEQYHREQDKDFVEFVEKLDLEEAKVIKAFLFHAKNMVDKHF